MTASTKRRSYRDIPCIESIMIAYFAGPEPAGDQERSTYSNPESICHDDAGP